LNSLRFVPWNKETEVRDLMQIDVGLMPLTDDPWSRGKCGFKALQYMALGIPCLASPVGVNEQIIDHGVNGYLCGNENDWKKHIVSLLKDENLRKRLGQKGREKVIEDYSVDSNSSNFISLFDL
ncbi:MAG: glycosyltransferase family 4 protein, partial [Cyclobacteriaceae bacterium]|nr:glycosyltransferase family 4 protein [Cyclobacteriaceae bacterium]